MCRATYQCYQIDSFLTARPSNRLGFKWVTKRQLLMRNTAHDVAPALDVSLGYMYEGGKGVPQDDVEAMRFYRLAAQQGHAKALFRLGDMTFDGNVARRDDVMAFQWFHLAAEQGYLKGQQFRAIVENRMSPADISEARKLASICLQSGYKDCGG